MIDLNPYIPPATQKKIGPVLMSDQAASELTALVREHGHAEVPLAPIATTVAGFLGSSYFERSDWFRRQPVHRTMTLRIGDDITPIMHLRKNAHGYTVISPDEAPVPENYCDERLIEETKVEIGIL